MNEKLHIISFKIHDIGGLIHQYIECEPTGKWKIDKKYSGNTLINNTLFLEVDWVEYKESTRFVFKLKFIEPYTIEIKHTTWFPEYKLSLYTVYNTEKGKVENCNG